MVLSYICVQQIIAYFLNCPNTYSGVGSARYEHAKTACKYRDSDS